MKKLIGQLDQYGRDRIFSEVARIRRRKRLDPTKVERVIYDKKGMVIDDRA